MEYKLTNFLNRQSQYPNRRKLVDVSTASEKTYDILRAEGDITQDGTPWNAHTMSEFDQKIANTFTKGTFTPAFYTQGPTAISNVDYGSRSAYYTTINNMAFVHIELRFCTINSTGYDNNKYLIIGALPDAIVPSFNGYNNISSTCSEASFRKNGSDIDQIYNSVAATIRKDDGMGHKYFYINHNRGSSNTRVNWVEGGGYISILVDFAYRYI